MIMKRYIVSAKSNKPNLESYAQVSDNILPYDKSEYDAWQLEELNWGIAQGLDVSVYADPSYSSLQMSEIREGLEQGIDVTKYANPKISHDDMRKIRENLAGSASYETEDDEEEEDIEGWPSFDFWESIEDDYDMEDAWDNYLSGPENIVNEELQIFTEPSVQGSMGSMFLYDESGGGRFGSISVDFQEWCDAELSMASSSKNADVYGKKYRAYIQSLIDRAGSTPTL